MEIRLDDPRRGPVAALLREHLEEMAANTPPESIHALDIEGLCAPEIRFFTASQGDALLGCAALLELDPRHGELKSMRTAKNHLRRGVASGLLTHVVAEARRRAYSQLSLETGSQAAFAPARALYTRSGFVYCDPFGDYRPDPNSVFLTRRL